MLGSCRVSTGDTGVREQEERRLGRSAEVRAQRPGQQVRKPTLHPIGAGIGGDCCQGSDKARFALEESQPGGLPIGLCLRLLLHFPIHLTDTRVLIMSQTQAQKMFQAQKIRTRETHVLLSRRLWVLGGDRQ